MNRSRSNQSNKETGLLKRFASLGGGLLMMLLAGLSAAFSATLPATEKLGDSDSSVPTFNRDIRPILSNHCYACHGPDSAARKAGLRLDLFGDATQADSGFAAIVPGDSQESEVWHRITSDDPGDQMPPPEIHKPLSDEQKQTLRRWIDAGAQYEVHWSFQPATEHAVPSMEKTDAPTAVDAFLRKALADRNLPWRSSADKETLIRRATLDLTGLPPTLAEIDAFLADDQPGAWERVLDRLLASPRFGDHWGRTWLDAARYADTHGLHLDNYREMWPYRDRVIELFNANIPYDEFVIGQLAGDLLPESTLQDQVSSGFVRAHPTTSEGGAINDEYRMIYSVDRTNTFGTVFLGLTLGCAQCHDHKFDPVSQEEYFGLYSFFNNTAEAEMDGNAKAHPPVVSVPSDQQQQQQAELETQLASLEEQKSEPNAEMDQAQAAYEASWLSDSDRWTAVDPQSATTTGGATFERLDDGSLLAVGNNPDQDTYTFSMIVEGGRYRALRLEGLLDDSLPGKGPGRSGNSNIVLTEIEGEAVAVNDTGEVTGEPIKIAWKHAYADHQQPNWPVSAAIDGNISLDDGWAVEGFNRKERRLAIFASDDPWGTEGPVQVTFQLHFGSRYTGHALGRVRLAIADDFMPDSEDRIWGDDEVPASGMVVNDGPEVDWDWVEGPEHRIHSGKRSRLQQTDADRIIQHYFVHVREPRLMRQGDQLYAWVYLDADTPPQTVMLQVNLNGSWEHRGFWGEDRITYGGTGVDTPGHRPLGELPPTGEWVRLVLDLEKVGLKAGDKINGIAFTQFGGKVYWDDFGLRGFGDALEWESLLTGPVPADDERSLTLRRDFYRSRHSPEYGVLLGEIESRRTELDQLKGQIPTTLVAAERMEMRSTRLLKRGQYDQPTGEPIPPSVPAFLPPLPEGETANRLGLARWLVDPQHPLFSRVTVNRIWQQLFGTGLVGTSEDFGLQGEWPSHPELLDHLARDFIARDWNLKQFIRSLMTTETYRMQTRTESRVRDEDPRNRLLGRGSRFRLDAEVIRDQALFLSGLLVEKMGGPGVKPYQPEGLWKAVGYVDSNTVNFVRDSGENLYRRSVYTFWKRTSPPPYLAIFDAPNRETCVVKRERTNTPMQALVLMNDVQYLEAARIWARNLLNDSATLDDTARITRLWRMATSRHPSAEELGELQAYLRMMRSTWESDPQQAEELLSVGEMARDMELEAGEHAAWMMLCHLILNLDEVVTKG
ncbi:MAG: PSD1 and planctomycete cytochrome C domain-containing protein [Planctomycetota bacterium]